MARPNDKNAKRIFGALSSLRRVSARGFAVHTKRLFRRQGKDVATAIRAINFPEVLSLGSLQKDDLIVSGIFPVDVWNEIFVRDLSPQVVSMIKAGFSAGADMIGISGLDFTSNDPRVRRTLLNAMGAVPSINEDSAQKLTDLILKGLDEGVSKFEIARRAQALFDHWSITRTNAAVRTFSTNAFSGGQIASFADAGRETKTWLSQRADNTRDTHFVADGQTVNIDQPFTVGSSEMMHPADSSLGADLAEIVNCNCMPIP